MKAMKEEEAWLRARIARLRSVLSQVTDERAVEVIGQLMREAEERLAELAAPACGSR